MKQLAALILILTAGLISAEQIKLDEQNTWQVYIEKPEVLKKDTPLCIMLPPGPGTENMAAYAVDMLAKPLAENGWYAAVPVSPDGKSFFTWTKQVKLLIEILKKRENIFQGKVLIGGISNGGISSIQMACEFPELFCGVIGVPGLVSGKPKLENLKNMPVFIRVGEKDELEWAPGFNVTLEQLKKAGVLLDAKLIKDAKHTFPVPLKELDAWIAGYIDIQTRFAEWKTADGKAVEAVFVKIEDENAVLRTRDGETHNVPVSMQEGKLQKKLENFKPLEVKRPFPTLF